MKNNTECIMRENRWNADLRSLRIYLGDVDLGSDNSDPIPPVPMDWGTSREMRDLRV